MELIDRAAAIATIREKGCLSGGYYDRSEIEDDVVDMLEDLPTVDAVPVVRCGKCVFATPFPSDAKPILCGNGQACRKNTTDFCSYSEPRTPPAE